MKTSIQILPGVKRIGWVDCRKLPARVDLAKLVNMPAGIFTEVCNIDFFSTPECKLERKKSGADFTETATLKFHTNKKLPEDIPLGFIVATVDGESFLIGSRENPLPVTEYEYTAGKEDGEASGYRYEVKHTALRTLIKCF